MINSKPLVCKPSYRSDLTTIASNKMSWNYTPEKLVLVIGWVGGNKKGECAISLQKIKKPSLLPVRPEKVSCRLYDFSFFWKRSNSSLFSSLNKPNNQQPYIVMSPAAILNNQRPPAACHRWRLMAGRPPMDYLRTKTDHIDKGYG